MQRRVETLSFADLKRREGLIGQNGQQEVVVNGNDKVAQTPDFSRDPRFYNPDDPRNISNRNPLNTTAVVVLCLVFLALIVAVIVLGVSLQGIANKNKEGCTLGDYDNFQRGFGIDNGSCFVEHSFNRNKRIEGCPETVATYYDLGGPDDGYKFDDPTLDDDDDPYSTETRFVSEDDPDTLNVLCFNFTEFDVVGGNPNCDNAFLNVTGSVSSDGVYCNENPIPDELICTAEGGAEITYNFTTDGSTDGDGWSATILCGRKGCTTPGYQNFDKDAQIDDGSCKQFHPPSNTQSEIMQLCGPGSYYDSGGPDDDYKNNEFVQKVFNSTDPNKKLCFEFVVWDVQDGCAPCCDTLIVDESSTGHDGIHCNGATSLQNEIVCSKPGEPIFFKFSSDASGTADGWGADVTCVHA